MDGGAEVDGDAEVDGGAEVDDGTEDACGAGTARPPTRLPTRANREAWKFFIVTEGIQGVTKRAQRTQRREVGRQCVSNDGKTNGSKRDVAF